jgi:Ca2+-binding RTX toxin-like protein
VLRGQAKRDSLDGGSGRDFFVGGAGDDTIGGVPVGDLGVDTVSYRHAPQGIEGDMNTGPVSSEEGFLVGEGGDTILGIEHFIGSRFADSVGGTFEANVMRGRGGPDDLHGEQGPDSLYGARGNDTLSGDAGVDSADGGPGDDRCPEVEQRFSC